MIMSWRKISSFSKQSAFISTSRLPSVVNGRIDCHIQISKFQAYPEAALCGNAVCKAGSAQKSFIYSHQSLADDIIKRY